jgi:hypothetical protein
MLVEESESYKSVFLTHPKNLSRVDFSKMLLEVIAIADEVDSQRKQVMFSYSEPRPSSTVSAA